MKVSTFKKRTIRLFALILIRYLYLVLTNVVLKDLWYQGSGGYNINFNSEKEFAGFVVFIFLAILYVNTRISSQFGDVFLELMFILYLIPMNCAFSLNDMSYRFLIFSSVYFVLIICLSGQFLKSFKGKEKSLRIGESKSLFDNSVINAVCILVCCVCVVYKIMYNGFSFSLSLVSEDVYQNREVFQENIDKISGSLIAYIFTFFYQLATYVGPIYFLVSIMRKNIIGVVVSLASILSMFSMSSGKGDIFFLAIVFFIVFLQKTNRLKNFSSIFVVCMIALLSVCALEMIVFKTSSIYMLIVRRVLYLPAWLNTKYFDFFSTNGKVMWTQSTFLLQRLLTPKYDVSVLDLISTTYFAGAVPSPNTGMFAEAYMHFGFLGIFIYPVLIALMLKFASKIFDSHDKYIGCAVAIKLLLQITNVSMVRTDFVLSFVFFTLIIGILNKFKLRL